MNTRGRLATEPEVVDAAIADACLAHSRRLVCCLLLTETWVRPGDAPPPLQGFTPLISVPSPLAHGRGQGGVAIYVADALVSRARVLGEQAEGRAWAQMTGVLDRPLHVAAVYMPPSLGREQRAAFRASLNCGVAAAHAAGAYIAVGGDFNARTASVSEECTDGGEPGGLLVAPPPVPRASLDGELNAQGRELLSYCSDSGLWIGNGRLPGDVPGQWTFYSLANAGAVSVADYFLLDADLIAQPGMRLRVCPPFERLDHCVLSLELGSAALPRPAEGAAGEELGPSPAGVEYRVDEHSIPAFVEAVAERAQQWAALATAADAAEDAAALGSVVGGFDSLVAECAQAAGMREVRQSRPPGWARRVSRPPATANLRRRRRRALRKGDRVLAAVLNRQACAAAKKHKRQRQRKQVAQMREWRKSDPARFARALRGQRAAPSASIPTRDWETFFQRLLGEQPAHLPVPTIETSQPGLESLPTQAREGLEAVHRPFTVEELCARALRVKSGKSVLGALKPTLLKRSQEHMAAPLTALLNACVRVGSMPHAWAVSALVPLLKPKGDALKPTGYRGIALGTLPAKLFAGMLNDRVTAFTEAAGLRAPGQAGFRAGFGCSDQLLTLRAIIERQRSRRGRLYACFVDFKQAFDRVPRHLLWHKLRRIGLDGWWLQAAQALYASVPMCVKMQAGYTGCFQALMGVKQGCPLSPTLYGLYLDDFAEGLMAEVGAERAELPAWQSGERVPPLFYADDQALLSVGPEGLQRQLQYLESYCTTWGLTVNTEKTKVVVYAPAAPRVVGDFRYGGANIARKPSFRYLGVELHGTHAFCSAAAARAVAGKQAMHILRRRMAQCGLHEPKLAMSLFDEYVRPVMSYGAEVWGPQLVTAALSGKASDACERVQLAFLRTMLGVRDTSPTLTVLAECGRLPLAVQWATQTARFVLRLVELDDGRIIKQAFKDSMALAAQGGDAGRGRRCWAAEVGDLLSLLGMSEALLHGEMPGELDVEEVRDAAARMHCQRYAPDACGPMVRRYQEEVLGGSVDEVTYAVPAPYLEDVPLRCRRVDLARVRTGCSRLPEDRGRTSGLSRDERPCPCGAGLGSAEHCLLECPLTAAAREQFASLFPRQLTLAEFLGGEEQRRVAQFVEACLALDAWAA